MLETEGMAEICESQLEEVGEYDVVMRVASKIDRRAIAVRLGPRGRAKLFTTERCCFLVE
jgi:hypothetical protein